MIDQVSVSATMLLLHPTVCQRLSTEDMCGRSGENPCVEGCGCGLMLGADGLCTEDPAGCIDSDGPSMQVPADPLTPGVRTAWAHC